MDKAGITSHHFQSPFIKVRSPLIRELWLSEKSAAFSEYYLELYLATKLIIPIAQLRYQRSAKPCSDQPPPRGQKPRDITPF